MDQRSQPVGGDLAVDLLAAEAWEECHEAYQGYLLASRVHTRCLRDTLEGRGATGPAGVVESGALARELLIEWLRKCEEVSQTLAWGQLTTPACASLRTDPPSLGGSTGSAW